MKISAASMFACRAVFQLKVRDILKIVIKFTYKYNKQMQSVTYGKQYEILNIS